MNQIITLMEDEIEKRIMALEDLNNDEDDRAKSERQACATAQTYLELVKEKNRSAETDEKTELERDRLDFEKAKLEFEMEKFEFEKEVKNEELRQVNEAAEKEAERNKKQDKIHLIMDAAKIGIPVIAYCGIAYVGFKFEAEGHFPTSGPLKETMKKLFGLNFK